MNDSIFCGSSVPLVAAIISSLTPLPNYFSSSPTRGMWVVILLVEWLMVRAANEPIGWAFYGKRLIVKRCGKNTNLAKILSTHRIYQI
jgi:hypothetical protein